MFDNAGAHPERPFIPEKTTIVVAGTRRNGITRTLDQIVPSQTVLDRLSQINYSDLLTIGGSLINDLALQGVWNRLRYFQVAR